MSNWFIEWLAWVALLVLVILMSEGVFGASQPNPYPSLTDAKHQANLSTGQTPDDIQNQNGTVNLVWDRIDNVIESKLLGEVSKRNSDFFYLPHCESLSFFESMNLWRSGLTAVCLAKKVNKGVFNTLSWPQQTGRNLLGEVICEASKPLADCVLPTLFYNRHRDMFVLIPHENNYTGEQL